MSVNVFDLAAAIAAQPNNEFCSHDIIEYLRRRQQTDYVEELHDHIDVRSYPMTETHRQIGQALLARADLITKIGTCTCPSPAALWRRL